MYAFGMPRSITTCDSHGDGRTARSTVTGALNADARAGGRVVQRPILYPGARTMRWSRRMRCIAVSISCCPTRRRCFRICGRAAATTYYRARKDRSPPSQRRVVETFTQLLPTKFHNQGASRESWVND